MIPATGILLMDMDGVFDVSFSFADRIYQAIVFVSGYDDGDTNVRVTSDHTFLRVTLPNGNLIFRIADILGHHVMSDGSVREPLFKITENITLQIFHHN